MSAIDAGPRHLPKTGEPVFLSSICFELGMSVPLDTLDDAEVRQHVAQLNADGLRNCLVSDRPPVEMASLCARKSLRTPAGPMEPDLAVLCSEGLAPQTPVRAAYAFAEGIGLPNVPVVNVSGNECGNFGIGLRMACGVLAAEQLSTVLLATSDRSKRRSRYLAEGTTAMSDGAASCLISTRWEGPGFAVLGMASASAPRPVDSGARARARLVLQAIRRITPKVLDPLGITATDCRYLVVSNYGRPSQYLFASATGLPQSALRTPVLDEAAHCHSADLLLSLRALAERDELKPGDRLVLISSGTRNWTVIAVEFVA